MAESTLTADFARLLRSVGRKANYGRDPSVWTGGLAYKLTDVTDYISSALDRFYAEYDWSFLKVAIEVAMYAPYTTGTIEIAAGVVTLTGGTWPTWAADGDLVSGLAYEVASRDSGTQITLKDTSITVASGSTYSLRQGGYTLPDDFGGFIDSHLSYRPNDTIYPRTLQLTSVERIRDMRAVSNDYADRPRYAAVIPKSDATTYTAGQRSKLLYWPTPSTASRALGRHKVLPNNLSATDKYAYGGMLHSATILAACLAEAAELDDHSNSAFEVRYQTFLKNSIERDKQAGNPTSLGFDRGTGPEAYSGELIDGIMPRYGLPILYF